MEERRKIFPYIRLIQIWDGESSWNTSSRQWAKSGNEERSAGCFWQKAYIIISRQDHPRQNTASTSTFGKLTVDPTDCQSYRGNQFLAKDYTNSYISADVMKEKHFLIAKLSDLWFPTSLITETNFQPNSLTYADLWTSHRRNIYDVHHIVVEYDYHKLSTSDIKQCLKYEKKITLGQSYTRSKKNIYPRRTSHTTSLDAIKPWLSQRTFPFSELDTLTNVMASNRFSRLINSDVSATRHLCCMTVGPMKGFIRPLLSLVYNPV